MKEGRGNPSGPTPHAAHGPPGLSHRNGTPPSLLSPTGGPHLSGVFNLQPQSPEETAAPGGISSSSIQLFPCLFRLPEPAYITPSISSHFPHPHFSQNTARSPDPKSTGSHRRRVRDAIKPRFLSRPTPLTPPVHLSLLLCISLIPFLICRRTRVTRIPRRSSPKAVLFRPNTDAVQGKERG
jgi:hypothetical protein